MGIFEAINYFRHFYIQNERAIAIAIAIAAELAASQMIGYPCLPIQQSPAYFLRHTYTGHTHDYLPLLNTDDLLPWRHDTSTVMPGVKQI